MNSSQPRSSVGRILPAVVTFLICSCTLVEAVDSREVKRLFRDPPTIYSTGPLWVWNDMLTEQQIRDTLRDMARQKVKQVWVHPRPGLMTPYLADDWFRLWRVALLEAQKLDMNVWIYDENSYPSGFAGGWVPEVMPESRGRGLSFKQSQAAPKMTEGLIACYRLGDGVFENVTEKIKAGQELPNGSYLAALEVRAGNSPWHGDRCYVNLLSPGVTEKFLELTLEPYKRNIGEQFGKRVPGVFTDEPNIRPVGELPWSEVLASEFQKRWGYDLLDHLPSLKQPIGDWRRVRHNYFQVLHEQFVEHWAKPYHDWCETNNLAWTGHYWDHDWPECVGVPDNMAMYAWHQWPAIDCLMNQYAENTHAQFGNVRMVRELSSVANQLGLKRTLCEIYGAGGWDLRFEDMKRIGDWLEVLGVNTLNQHLSYVTLRGARKRDHPLSFSYHDPWWKAYHVSADYFARLSMALSQGEQINDLLVIEPTTTAWMYQHDGAKLGPLGDAFSKLLMSLETAQVEYDLGCEDILARSGVAEIDYATRVVSEGASAVVSRQAATPVLKVGNRSYSKVMIPPGTENLNSETVKLIEGFLTSGDSARVLCFGEPPGFMDGKASDRLLNLSRHAGWVKVDTNCIPRLAPAVTTVDAVSITREKADPGILFHMRRHIADGQILFLVNTSLDSPSVGTIEAGLKSVEEWDLYTGQTRSYPFQTAGEGLRTRFSLPPSGSLLLFLSPKPGIPSMPAREVCRTIEPVADPKIRRLEPNVLVLDYLDVQAQGESRTNLYFYQANQFVWEKNGMPRNPWDSAVQFKSELISREFPADSGFAASYKFTIENAIPENLAIVIERPDLYRVTCNGQSVQAKPGDWWLDKAFGRIPIAKLAHPGENVVTITASPFTMFHELEPAYLIGNFTLQPGPRGFTVLPDQPLRLGSLKSGTTAGLNSKGDLRFSQGWNSQGHPFYGAAVAYTETFEVTRKAGRFSVVLPSWYGTIAEVKVNGKSAGYIDAPPWEKDVTKWIKRGQNSIEVAVYGTLKNTLGPHHGNPGRGAAWPGNFQKGTNPGPAPGASYDTVAYGLFAPFVLKQATPEPAVTASF